MKIISRQILAQDAATKWARQYDSQNESPHHVQIGLELKALADPVNPDDVDRIVGNTSWTYVRPCDGCKKHSEMLVEVGEELDYESSTAYLCTACLRAALDLVDGV